MKIMSLLLLSASLLSGLSHANEISRGTGFAITTNGYIVTNYHFLQNADSVKAVSYVKDDKISYNADLIVFDETSDLAILKITDTGFKLKKSIPYVIDTYKYNSGDIIFSVGFPLDCNSKDEMKQSFGEIEPIDEDAGNSGLFSTTIPYQPGFSGGPIFDKSGHIIGILCSTQSANNSTFQAINVKPLLELIADIPTVLTLNKYNSLRSLSASTQAILVRDFIFTIEAY